jgi:hypothetical protein
MAVVNVWYGYGVMDRSVARLGQLVPKSINKSTLRACLKEYMWVRQSVPTGVKEDTSERNVVRQSERIRNEHGVSR